MNPSKRHKADRRRQRGQEAQQRAIDAQQAVQATRAPRPPKPERQPLTMPSELALMMGAVGVAGMRRRRKR